MRIDHLSLMNWRNFKTVDVSLGNRLFVVGPNASGKSNLLDALRFLRDVATDGGGLQHAVKTRGGLKRVRCLAARNFNYGRVGLELTLGSAGNGPTWTYRLHFTAEQRGRHRPIIRREVVSKDGKTIIDRPDRDDKADEERLTQTAMEQVNSNRDFRPVVEFLDAVRYLHLVPQLIRDPGLGQGPGGGPFGSDFLVRMAKTREKTRVARLNRINTALRCVVPQLEDLSLERDQAGRPHLQARYKHWRKTGAKQNEHDFSDGTLRLIGLLWLIQERAGKAGRIILLEEPELSLHTSIVRQLPTVLNRAARHGRSQIILSTHSTELLEDPGLGLDEVLVLKPGDEGTIGISAAEIPEIDILLEAGITLAEILGPETAPPTGQQLTLL